MSLSGHPVLEESGGQAELPAALCAALMDPAYWHEGLDRYARTTNLAVALVDGEGRLLGPVLNPQPLWSLFHTRKPAVSGECPFCLAPLRPCSREAVGAEHGLVIARDRTGLVHLAVPLLLRNQCLGTLLAGQVFDQYPEQLALEQAAKQFGLPPQEVWHLAIREHPVKLATLQVYGELLLTLGRTFLLTRYHTLREAERLAEMTRLRDQAVAETAERRRAEEALQEADQRKDAFLAMLAHELRNPLAPIRNALEVMRLKGPADPELQWAREVIDRQVQQQTRLVDDLWDVARISRGKIILQLEPVDLATVVARAVEMSRPLIDARKHRLEISLPQQAVRVKGDPTRLAQVVSNLLNNAAKYSEEGSSIWLTVEPNAGEALLRVRDTGFGIAPEMLPNIFEMFTQAQGSGSCSEGGLGIGLSLVRSLVEMHRGRVQATSAGIGHGSEFSVCLPRLQQAASPAAPETKPVSPRILPARRILVVDDNSDAAESLAMLLRLLGHQVCTACDGPTALEAARVQPPEVVLLDIGLPAMSGLEVARRMRQDLGLTDALLVALTGYGQEEDKRRSQAAGFDAHLVKPVDLDALQELLARARSPLGLLGERGHHEMSKTLPVS